MATQELNVLILGDDAKSVTLAGEVARVPGIASVRRAAHLEESLNRTDTRPDIVVVPVEACSAAAARAMRNAYPDTTLVVIATPDRRPDARHAVPERADALLTVGRGDGFTLIDIHETLTRSRSRVDPSNTDAGIDVVDGLLSHISHELRTPLTAIHCSVELLANNLDGLPSELSECMEIAMRNTDQLGKIIGDLIDAADIHRGRLPIDIECIDGNLLARDLLESAGAVTFSSGLSLRARVAPDLDPVLADVVRVRQVFANLLDNAVRHSPPAGTITVEIGDDRSGFVRISISDEGPGIPPETLAEVFELFTRASPTSPRSRQGLGLGLALSRDLVQRQGGHLWVENVPGQGAKFSFTLPVFSLAEMISTVIDCDDMSPTVSVLAVDLFPSADPLEEMTRRSIMRECSRTLRALIDRGGMVVQGIPESEASVVFVLSNDPRTDLEAVHARLREALEQRPIFRGVVHDPHIAVRTFHPAAQTNSSVWQMTAAAAADLQAFLDAFAASTAEPVVSTK